MEETVCTVADCFVAIYASRTYNADRRLRNFHHSTLYGRGMCAQHYIGMCLNKKGILHVTSRMVFAPGARNTFLYQTPYGTSTVGLETQRYRSTLGEHGGVLDLLYVVDFDHACANRNQLKITVREQ